MLKITRQFSTNNHYLVSNWRSSPRPLRLDTLRRNPKVIVTKICLRPLNGGTGRSAFTRRVLIVNVPGPLAVVRLYCTADIPGYWS